MPLNPLNFSARGPQSEQPDLLQKFMAGYNLNLVPRQAEADVRRTELENALKEVQGRYAEPLAQIALKQAQTPQMGDFAKILQDREQIRQMYGENSQEYKLASDYVARKAQGSQGLQFSVGPDGSINFSQGGPAGAGGKGSMSVDQYGNIVQSLTSPVSTALQQQELAKKSRKIFDEIDMPYKGQGASKALASDLLRYNQTKDPAEKARLGKKLIEGGLAVKSLNDKVIDQLVSQGLTSPTVSAIEHQNKAATQGWSNTYGLLLDNLPPELQQEVDNEYNNLLDRIGEERAQHAIRGIPIKPKSTQNYSQTDLEHTAKKYGMSVEELLIQLEED